MVPDWNVKRIFSNVRDHPSTSGKTYRELSLNHSGLQSPSAFSYTNRAFPLVYAHLTVFD